MRTFSRRSAFAAQLRACSSVPMPPVSINAGGKHFTASYATLCDRFPQSSLASSVRAHVESKVDTPMFVDMDGAVFEEILEFLRTGVAVSSLSGRSDRFSSSLTVALETLGLQDFYSTETPNKQLVRAEGVPILPKILFVQVSDSIQMDQGHKRHAISVTFGADGLELRKLCSSVRRSLNDQLSSTFWQCYQTNERAVFLVTSKLAGGTADLLTTSLSQCILEHLEEDMGYTLVSSNVALTPDIKNLNVRMFIQSYVFRRSVSNSAPTQPPKAREELKDNWPE